MKLLVTGVCGRLGRAIATEASAQGMTVVGLDIVGWPADVDLPANVHLNECSFEDLDRVARLLEGCDAMIHTAGPHGGFVETLDLPGFLEGNVVVAARLLEAGLKAGLKGVNLASTMEVLVGRNWDTSGAAFLDEDSPPQTDSAYSLSRLLGEHLAREFSRQHGLATSCIRYSGFGYMPDEDLGPRLLARTISPRDAARATILAATNYDLKGDLFLIAPEAPHRIVDMAMALTDPYKVLEEYFPGASAILARRDMELLPTNFWPICSTRKAHRVLGWRAELNFENWLNMHGWKRPE
jgi:UDP-glucose 4-epimerase